MRRLLAAFLAALLFFGWIQPVWADVGLRSAGLESYYDLQLIDPNSPRSGFRMKESFTPGSGGKFSLVSKREISEESFRYIVKYAQAAGVNDFQVEDRNRNPFASVGRFFRNVGKTPSMYMDVARALDKVMEEGMVNLNDVQKRYEFWKQVGIYDKYSPEEIRYINKAVLPLVAIGKGIKGTGCAMIAAGSMGFLASGGNPAVAAVTALLGAGTFAGEVTYKTLRVKGLKFEFTMNNEESSRPTMLPVDKNDPSLEISDPYGTESITDLNNVSPSLRIYMDPKRGGDITSISEDSLFSKLNILLDAAVGTGDAALSVFNGDRVALNSLRNSPEVQRLRQLAAANEIRAVGGEIVAIPGGVAVANEIRTLVKRIKFARAVKGAAALGLGLAGGYCGSVAMRTSYELTGLFNAWGIPVPGADPVPVPVEWLQRDTGPSEDVEAKNYQLIYGLRR